MGEWCPPWGLTLWVVRVGPSSSLLGILELLKVGGEGAVTEVTGEGEDVLERMCTGEGERGTAGRGDGVLGPEQGDDRLWLDVGW